MKLKVLAFGAAVASISCVTPCSAQLKIESPATPYPQSRLAFQSSEVASDVFSQAPAAQAASTDSDYFAPGAPGDGLGNTRSILAEQPSIFTSAPPSAASSVTPSAPPSIQPGMPPIAAPVPAPAQTSLGVLAGTPEVGMVPVCWPEGVGGCRTPNPIADYMMRNWCTDGLWATYPAQRACQCAHIQHHTGGYNRYTNGCGTCDTCAGAYAPNAWPAQVTTGFAQNESAPPASAIEVQRPVAQLVISPVMSAPAQLPSAQAAPSQTPSQTLPQPAQAPQPAAPEYQVTPSPLPIDPLPADVPVVASRPRASLR